MGSKIKPRQVTGENVRVPRNSQVEGMLGSKKGGFMRDRRLRRPGEKNSMRAILKDQD